MKFGIPDDVTIEVEEIPVGPDVLAGDVPKFVLSDESHWFTPWGHFRMKGGKIVEETPTCASSSEPTILSKTDGRS